MMCQQYDGLYVATCIHGKTNISVQQLRLGLHTLTASRLAFISQVPYYRALYMCFTHLILRYVSETQNFPELTFHFDSISPSTWSKSSRNVFAFSRLNASGDLNLRTLLYGPSD